MKPFDFSIGDLFHPFEGRKFNHIDVPCLDRREPDRSVRNRAQYQTVDEGLVAPVVGEALEHKALARLPLKDLEGTSARWKSVELTDPLRQRLFWHHRKRLNVRQRGKERRARLF